MRRLFFIAAAISLFGGLLPWGHLGRTYLVIHFWCAAVFAMCMLGAVFYFIFSKR